METIDLVVVGGGLAGLAAAGVAARAGLSVVLFERSGLLGGRARTRAISGGFSLNLGAHALYRGGPAARVLGSLRVPTPGRRAPATGLVLRSGERHALPAGPLSMMTTSLLDAADKVELARLFVWLRGLVPATLEGRSVREVLDDRVQRPRNRAVFTSLMTVATYDEAPDVLCAAAVLTQVQRAAFEGVTYVDGGWQTLVVGLETTARSLGASLVAGARVEGIERVGERFVVTAGGRQVLARSLVLATPPTVCRGWFPEIAQEPRGETRVACLDVALGTVPRPRDRFAISVDAPLYYSLHSATARLAEEGRGVAHLLRYRTSEGAESELRGLLDQMQPGAEIVEARYLPEMTVAHDRPLAVSGGLAARARVTAAPGVFLAGDWVGDEGLLADAALASAASAAESAATHVRAVGRRAA